jgi:phytoene dehydrogenase-like protein
MAHASQFDAIVVGAGHNGLTCAAYLTRAGRRVAVLEAASQVGGAAVSAEFHPGYTVSSCAHILHLLHPKVLADLQLARHGLRFSTTDMATVALHEDGRHITLSSDEAATSASIAAHSETDAGAHGDFRRRMLRFAGALQPALAAKPPRLAGDWRDKASLAKLAWAVRKLGRDDMRDFLRIIGSNAADVLGEAFESDLLRGAYAFDAVLGAKLGPRSPNSVLTLFYRLAGEQSGHRGHLAHPVGGMGAVTRALAGAASRADIRTDSAVTRIILEDDRAVGVELASGEQLFGRCVVSGADPRTTFLDMVGPEHLDTGFVRRIKNIRMGGVAAKINLALDGLPTFSGLEASELGARLLIAPSVDYVERAFNHCKYGEFSDEPAMEITIPSVHDGSLAPEGGHVLSAVVQFAPYDLKAGWDSARDAFADRAIEIMTRYAPDLQGRIVSRQVITPLDLERDFRMTGGHWHHGELAPDQMFMLRPVPGHAQYQTPVPGLYLCGAGAHPGGGVMGAAGYNAAKQIINREGPA